MFSSTVRCATATTRLKESFSFSMRVIAGFSSGSFVGDDEAFEAEALEADAFEAESLSGIPVSLAGEAVSFVGEVVGDATGERRFGDGTARTKASPHEM